MGPGNGLGNLEISIKIKKTHTPQTKNLLLGNLSHQNKSNDIKSHVIKDSAKLFLGAKQRKRKQQQSQN